jgi:hypothetical protein
MKTKDAKKSPVKPPLYGPEFNKFLVLWSPRQRCFHIETIKETVEAGLDSLLFGTKVDYIPVAMADTRIQANNYWDVVHAYVKLADKRKSRG